MTKINILALIFKHHKNKVLLLLLSLIVFINTIVYTHIYTVFDVIQQHEIRDYLVSTTTTTNGQYCHLRTFDNSQLQIPDLHPPHDLQTWAQTLNISNGEWKPNHCTSPYTVTIIVPYRNREQHLQTFLYYIHPFLQTQNIHYKLYIVEQSSGKDFNRGKLFNVGFVEATKDESSTCFIFHDVDLIPQNLNNIYACTKYPRHMSSSIDKYRYKVPYDRNFGGVTAILSSQFEQVNGFSNHFYGWGGEDDDFFNRIRNAELRLNRFTQDISRYYSLKHEKAAPSSDRFTKLNQGYRKHLKEGLNNLQYEVKSKVLKNTHIHLVIDL